MRKKTAFFLLIIFLLTFSVLLINDFVKAQGLTDKIVLNSPFASTTLEGVVNGFINFIFQTALIIAPLMVVVGGFLFATAGGNAEQLIKAKKVLSWTAIGFAIVLLARVIFEAIKAVFQG
jgi:hypothetical protein